MQQRLAAAPFYHSILRLRAHSRQPYAAMQYGGDWDGSNVHEDHVEFLRKTQWLPGADKVRVRLALEKEITPEPEEGERVVFRSHFLRGIGLPASAFFRSFLEFY